MKIAVIGATGAVGREMLEELEEMKLPADAEVFLFASGRSAGETLSFRGKRLVVKEWVEGATSGMQAVLMSAGGEFSKKYAQSIAEGGAVVIDNSSAWRSDKNIPLVVPEVNADQIQVGKPGIIANPNCSTIQMVVPLAAVDAKFGLEMVNVSTYQSVSGSGQKGIVELSGQIKNQFNLKEPEVCLYPQQIAFNILPSIGSIDEQGQCEEEVKMVQETRKILSKPKLPVLVTTARVPVINCHCESVTVNCRDEVTQVDLEKLFESIPGVIFDSKAKETEFPSPLSVAGRPEIFVSRLRLPYGEKKSKTFQFWIVADNLKKGAATNAVQIFSAWSKI